MSDKHNKKSRLSVLVESFIITVVFIVISKLLHDPLSLNSPYPWIWFAPVLVALHYGLVASQFSLCLLLADYLYKDPSPIYMAPFQLFILGGFILTFICATWQNSYSKKLIYSDGISNYLQKRIQSIAHAYKLTSLAYKRLENNYIANPVTIRTSMNEIRNMLETMKGETQASILSRLIHLLAVHCSLEKAAFYPVKDNKIIAEPIATIGAMSAPSPDHYFIQSCIDNKALTYITAEEILKGHLSDYLLGVPLVNQNNIIYAVLLVEEMPFLNLNDENLATINLLVHYFIEGNIVDKAELILDQFPDCPVVFANEVQRLMNLERVTKKDSAIEVFKILDKTRAEDYLFRLKKELRGLDSWWESMHEETPFLLVLMPLSNREAAESYKMRINEILFNEFGFRLNQKEIKFNSYQLSSCSSPVALIEELFKIK